MSGPKRNPDKLNTIGVVVVGICGAVMVYVTIVALQAFYMNDTSEIQTMADYGGQDTTAKAHKAGRRLSQETMTKMQSIHDGLGALQDEMRALMGYATEEDVTKAKSAIRVHHTATDDNAWDAATAEKRVTSPNDAGASYF